LAHQSAPDCQTVGLDISNLQVLQEIAGNCSKLRLKVGEEEEEEEEEGSEYRPESEFQGFVRGGGE